MPEDERRKALLWTPLNAETIGLMELMANSGRRQNQDHRRDQPVGATVWAPEETWTLPRQGGRVLIMDDGMGLPGSWLTRVLPGGIRTRLFLLIALTLLPMLLLLGWICYRGDEARRLQALQTELEVAQGVVDALADQVGDIRRQSYVVGQGILAFSDFTPAKAARLLKASLSQYPTIRVMYWVNPEGTVLASSVPEAVGRNLSDRPCFREVAKGQSWAFGDLTNTGPVTSSPTVGMATAVRDESGKLRGMVVVTFEPARLGELILTQQRPGGGVYTIFDRQGAVVYRSPTAPPTWEERVRWREGDPVLQRVLETGRTQTGVTRLPISGSPWIVARIPIADIGWVAGAERPVEIAMGPVRHALLQDGAIALGVSALAILLAYLLARTIADPLRRLGRDAQTMGTGRIVAYRDPQAPTEVRGLRSTVEQMATTLLQHAETLREGERQQRKLAETLEVERGKLAAAIENLPVGVGITDAEGRSLSMNSASLEILGGDPAEEMHTRLGQYVGRFEVRSLDGRLLPVEERPLSKSLRGEFVRDCEVCVRNVHSGLQQVVSYSAAPVRNHDGQTVLIVHVFHDLTERKRAEERLRQSEERYRTLVESQTELVTRILPDGTVTFVNEAVCRQLGLSREELVGRSLLPLILPEDRPSVQRTITSITPQNPVAMIEDRVVGAGGQIRWMQWSCCGGFDAQGHLIECQAVGRDMTDRKKAEEALQKSEELRCLTEEAGAVGSFEWNLPTGEEWWSPELEAIYGLELGSFGETHEAWLKTLHPDDRPKVEAWITEAMAHVDAKSSFDFRIIRPDRQVRWLEARRRIICDHAGEPERIVGVNVDITRRKQAEQALQSLNETLEQRVMERTAVAEWRAAQLQRLAVELAQAEERERRRLARVLHDHLQQLLVAAKLRLNPAARRVEDARIATGITQAVSLIDQAITESRSLTSELSPPVLYDRGLVAGLEWLARRSEEHYHLSVVVETAPEAEPEDQATKAFVFQAARELILNAQKHGQASAVKLQLTKVDEDHLQLAVTDDGVGFDPEVLEARTDAGGFGLFSIRERLDLKGGNLEITSSPGQGTKAALVVPLRHVRQATDRINLAPNPIVVPTQRSSAKVGRVSVLLADDHPLLRRGLAEMLVECPDLDLVGEAADGQEAVEAALQLRPDVVLMDVTMPRLDGIEATRRIKQEAPEICVIGLSMHEGADMASAMRSAGASEYLAKTVAAEDLLATIVRQRACRERDAE